jgi:hypothetical protein
VLLAAISFYEFVLLYCKPRETWVKDGQVVSGEKTAWSVLRLQKQIKILLVALAILVTQTLAGAIASAHDADAGHTHNDCAICLSVQGNDCVPPEAGIVLETPPGFYWAAGKAATQDAVLKTLAGKLRARAPPH